MEPGSRWKHYKGNEYALVCLCRLEATKEPHVVYVLSEDYPYGEHWVRPLSEWSEEVSLGVKRFTRVES